MQINKHGSFYIRNGWPTKIMDAITNDPLIFSPNNELNAVDVIGVGRVMVKSMRYWASVMGITFETKVSHGVFHKLTELGKQIVANDPYCQGVATLWLLHRNLARSEDDATAWWWLYNDCDQQSFTKDSFSSAFHLFLQRHGETYPKKSVEKEFDCLKNTYVSEKAFDVHKVVEEDTVPFFAPLRLMQYIGNNMFEKRKPKAKEIPINVLHYCILADNAEHLLESTEIDIDTLLESDKQVGRYMNLSYSTLLELLQQLENAGKLKLVNNFGNRYIHLLDVDSVRILGECFERDVR